MTRLVWLTPAMLALLAAQPYKPGPQVAVFISDVDGNAQPYGLYVPKDFDPSRSYPLVISLHSEGSNHRLELRRLFGRGNFFRQTDAEAANGPFPNFPKVDSIVACPLARGTMGYQGIAEKDVYDVLADVKAHFLIDEDRVYLAGTSMGGGGALRLALTRPDVWAAVVLVCPSVPGGIEDLAPNALGLPVKLIQGARDPLVPAVSTQEWRDRLLDVGALVDYTEYPLARHNVYDYAYRGASIFDWLAKFRRNRFPAEVRFRTRNYRYTSSFWVQIDGLTPGEIASIDAKFTEPNRIVVHTEGVDGFTLRPTGHSMFDGRRRTVVQVDEVQFQVNPGGKFVFARGAGSWAHARYFRPPGAKQPGQEGPIREAVARKHIYAYGTADSPDESELANRRTLAEKAANWTTPRLPLLLTLRAEADREVTEQDLTGADLVLFGNSRTNSLIARFAPQMPIELNPSAADYGLLMITPADGRYILVNSGLPWWNRAPLRQPEKPDPDAPPPYKALMALSDYVLYRRSLDHVVASGNFDRNWKLPAGQAAQLAATGVVQIR